MTETGNLSAERLAQALKVAQFIWNFPANFNVPKDDQALLAEAHIALQSELDALKHDIERQQEIGAVLATENARLAAEVERLTAADERYFQINTSLREQLTATSRALPEGCVAVCLHCDVKEDGSTHHGRPNKWARWDQCELERCPLKLRPQPAGSETKS